LKPLQIDPSITGDQSVSRHLNTHTRQAIEAAFGQADAVSARSEAMAA
jgi:hypothetical protein